MPHSDEIWYAAKATRVILAPRRELETFGETSIHYYVVSALLDAVNQVRVRQGQVQAERPRVITPRYFVSQALENFGKEAQEYIEGILNSAEGVRILQYGLRFRKQEYSEETVQGNTDEVADQVSRHVRDRDELFSGVIIGVDDLWEVSLLRFVSDVVRGSAPGHFRELAGRGLLDAPRGNVPNAVRIEIESEFRAAAGDRERIGQLGRKLREYGLFAEYEDRFFALLKETKK